MLNQCYIFGGNINFMSLFVNVYHVFERIANLEIPDFISFYKYFRRLYPLSGSFICILSITCIISSSIQRASNLFLFCVIFSMYIKNVFSVVVLINHGI